MTVEEPSSSRRSARLAKIEQIRRDDFTSFKSRVDSLHLKSGDSITLTVTRAGYDDRGPEFVTAEMKGLYKGIDSEKRGIRVELEGAPQGEESLFILDSYESIIIKKN